MSPSTGGCCGSHRYWPTPPSHAPHRRGPMVCGRDVREGRRQVALRLPGDRPGRPGHRRVRSRAVGRSRRPPIFERAIGTTKVTPAEVTSDRAPVYPAVLEELLPAAWHRTDRYANNWVECDHGRLKARLGPMRGLKQDRSARVIITGHAFIQNVRRRHYELAAEEPATGGWRLRSTSWPWPSDAAWNSRLQHALGRRNATAPLFDAAACGSRW
jgi:hypothetical protein